MPEENDYVQREVRDPNRERNDADQKCEPRLRQKKLRVPRIQAGVQHSFHRRQVRGLVFDSQVVPVDENDSGSEEQQPREIAETRPGKHGPGNLYCGAVFVKRVSATFLAAGLL